MGDVSLADTVENVGTQWSHQSSVDGSKSTSGESPGLGRVMSCESQQSGSKIRARIDLRKTGSVCWR